MKYFYLVGSIILLVVMLIIAFSNIAAVCNYLMFFFKELPGNASPVLGIFFLEFLGIITGFFIFGFFMELFKKEEEDI